MNNIQENLEVHFMSLKYYPVLSKLYCNSYMSRIDRLDSLYITTNGEVLMFLAIRILSNI